MRRVIAVLLAGLLLIGCGCGTISDLSNEEDGHRVFGGIRKDSQMIADPDPKWTLPSVVFGILDFPLSLVLDTLCLPVTLSLPAEPSR